MDCSKTDLCSLIASPRNLLPGHRLRHKVVEDVRARGADVEIMGRGYRPYGPAEEGLAPFRYSIVIENSAEPGYFTEKIVDALICRTIPIYWGAPDIEDFFDPTGMIVCRDLSELRAAIAAMSPEDYEARQTAITRNRDLAMQYVDVQRRAASLVLEGH